jgi:hypothetical protein
LAFFGMIATCLAALSGQPPKPEGARLWARGVDGESARRAIMAMPLNASRYPVRAFAFAAFNLEKKTVQPNDNPIGTRLSPMS